MEDQNKVDVHRKKIELKNLLISNLEDRQGNEASSSHEDAKTSVESSSCDKKDENSKTEETETAAYESKRKSEKSKKKTRDQSESFEKTSSTGSQESKSNSLNTTPKSSSPEPSCAICLEHLTDKSFPNGCFHMFCFKCLVEWSKVKPECPLCKQSFTIIVHNVRSFQEYETYDISSKSRTTDTYWSHDRRFRYRTTLTSDRILSRVQEQYAISGTSSAIDNEIIDEIASHRLRYAPHSVRHMRLYSQPRRMPSIFRRRVYEENLWVHPPDGSRIRFASPAFFQRNIACTHRLLPWLNRELLVVMSHNESEIGFMIDLIMSLILKYNIRSQEFYTHIEPYTGSYTRHFIHEFYNFAISPYEMVTYDYHAQYDVDIRVPNIDESSPDSDVIPLTTIEASQNTTTGSEAQRKKKGSREQRERSIAEIRRLEKLVLKRNSQNMWETVVTFPFSFGNISNSNAYEVPGPSTSRNPLIPAFNQQDTENRNESAWIDDDGEVEIVQVLKPKCERTPEIVNLSSDDENIASSTNVTSNVKVSLLGDVIELSSDMSISSADEGDIVFIEQKNAIPEMPIDYSLKKNDISFNDQETSPKPKEIEPTTSAYDKDSKSEQSSKKKVDSVIKSAIQVVSNDDSQSSSWSPSDYIKRKRSVNLEGSSTESLSDDNRVRELDSNVKKLKLRSVVAHFSVDHSDKNDSSHHSSHKKHKEKRKKKKKHKHRHYKIYSSESS